MGGYIQVNRLSALVLDEKEDIERLKGQSLHHEQMGRPDAGELVAKEGAPGQARRTRRPWPAVSADRSGAHDEAR
jgi:hypothetical protein